MELYQTLSSIFWNTEFWLPPNTTWSDVAPNSHPEIRHVDSNHLILYPLPIAFGLLVLRRFLEKGIFAPLGIFLGINAYEKQRKALHNTALEWSFQFSRRPSHRTVKGLAKHLDWSEIKVQRWFRTRWLQDKPTTLIKFSESMWRLVYYSFLFIFGCVVLWDKEWLWDIQLCWKNYPHQSVDDGIWWYYMISLSFYWSLCFTQFVDVKRRDFWQMFAHHIASIAMLSISWVCNMTRIGSLVLLIHDCPDTVLEFAKCAKFAGYQKICNYSFALLVPLWMLTRCGFYPFLIITTVMIGKEGDVLVFPAFHILNIVGLGLFMLHVFWTYLMLKLVRRTFAAGLVPQDVRSESED